MNMYKRKSLQFCNEAFSRAVRKSEMFKARESSRFKHLSNARDLTSEEMELTNSIDMEKDEAPRSLKLLKWKQERQLRKELEMKLKKKPFYIGRSANQPASKNLPKKILQNMKSSFMDETSSKCFNASKIVKSKLINAKSSSQQSKIPSVSKQATSVHKNDKTPTVKSTFNENGSSLKIPSQATSVHKNDRKPIVKSTYAINSTKAIGSSLKTPNQQSSLPKVTLSKLPNKQIEKPSSLPKVTLSKLPNKQIEKQSSIPKVNASKLPNKLIQKQSSLPQMNPSKSCNKPIGKTLPKVTLSKLPNKQIEKMPAPNAKPKCLATLKPQKMPVPNVNQKSLTSSNAASSTKNISNRKGYCFKTAVTDTYKHQTECKNVLKQKTNKEKTEEIVSLSEQSLVNIPDLSFNIDVSIIKPKNSFAPADFQFRPPIGLPNFVFDDEDPDEILEEIKLKYTRRTSTPSKESEKNCQIKYCMDSFEDFIIAPPEISSLTDKKNLVENAPSLTDVKNSSQHASHVMNLFQNSSPLMDAKNSSQNVSPLIDAKNSPPNVSLMDEKNSPPNVSSLMDEKNSPPNVSTLADGKDSPQNVSPLMDEKNSPPNIFTLMNGKSSSPNTSSLMKEKNLTPNVSSLMDEKNSPQNIFPLMDEKNSPPNIFTLMNGKSSSPNTSSLMKEKNLTPNLCSLMDEKNSPQNIFPLMNGKDSSSNVSPLMDEKNSPPNVSTLADGKDSPQNVSPLMDEKNSPPNIFTLMNGKSSSPNTSSLMKEKNLTPNLCSLMDEKNSPQNIFPLMNGKDSSSNVSPLMDGKNSPPNVSPLMAEKNSPENVPPLTNAKNSSKKTFNKSANENNVKENLEVNNFDNQSINACELPSCIESPLNILNLSEMKEVDEELLPYEEINAFDISEENEHVRHKRKSAGSAYRRVSLLKSVSTLNAIAEADDDNTQSFGESTKDDQISRTNPCRSKKLSASTHQNRGILNELIPEESDFKDIPATPRRSLRLQKARAATPVLSPSKQGIPLRRSMRLIDLNTPEKSGNQPHYNKSNLTFDFAKLKLEESENVGPDAILLDFENSPVIASKSKSRKVSLLYTPEKIKGTRKSIKGDLIAFSPSN